ncbi:sugar-transfer associated ATP-grasp domain-containing protein [Agriterribacter sp.]|uniref:sugar-transfer associated ATP-grasp domain-containing protein n=1 Tax=Agriterribacter sp. TaxID=2821509 RepID=UPI002C43DFB8|nr:sugar-transfer associated ATP-grasp domain-containing protein [Agriterribacter sp.]HRO48266.1 sugar-transfer associated ATP-grasp domain-containing protein [Agriterribacter sp.]HRQ18093.1 sugar-transfer associated ATP-grasp domain-containing protein [Agriterribacter sp.]
MFKHNASPLDYFSFNFFDLSEEERATYPCTGFMYEYQLKMNPRKERAVLHDKIKFLELLNDFSGRQWASIAMLKSDKKFATEFLSKAGKKLVLKNSTGGAGKQVEVIEIPSGIPESVIALMEAEHFDLAEHYVIQHDELMRMSPSGVNTVRVVTQYIEGRVIILFAFLRVSVNSSVDNLSVGNYGVNFGAAINIETGVISGPGVYLDITKPDVYYHPVTQTPVIGFKIPYWDECKNVVIKVSALTSGNRSVGWDVAITNEGPVLIEGNHNWNLLSMSPGRKGFKKEFLQYSTMI